MNNDLLIVAGANGYLGRAIINAHAGSRPMLAIVRSDSAALDLPVPALTYDRLNQQGLPPDTDASRAAIIHVAGSSRERWPGCVWDGNFGTVERVAAAATAWGVGRVVLASGFGIPPHTQSIMFQAKLAAEELLMRAVPGAVVVRLSYVLGGADELTPQIRRHALTRGNVYLPGSGTYRMNPTHVDDVVSVLTRLALYRRDITGPHDFVGEPVSYRTLVEDIVSDHACTVTDGDLEELIRSATLDPDPALTLSQIGVLVSDIWSESATPLADVTPRTYEEIVGLLRARFRARETPGG